MEGGEESVRVLNGKKKGACVCEQGGLRASGEFERKCLLLTWPWGPIMGLLGLCGGGCAWGDC